MRRVYPGGQYPVSLDQAITQMNTFARRTGYTGLLMERTRWEELVLRHMQNLKPGDYINAVIHAAGLKSLTTDEYPEFIQNCMQIWSATPQPDRGGLSAYELFNGQRPQAAHPGSGRNELCPCGSGRKYKHCHGR